MDRVGPRQYLPAGGAPPPPLGIYAQSKPSTQSMTVDVLTSVSAQDVERLFLSAQRNAFKTRGWIEKQNLVNSFTRAGKSFCTSAGQTPGQLEPNFQGRRDPCTLTTYAAATHNRVCVHRGDTGSLPAVSRHPSPGRPSAAFV
jgi:hypothetical protein